MSDQSNPPAKRPTHDEVLAALMAAIRDKRPLTREEFMASIQHLTAEELDQGLAEMRAVYAARLAEIEQMQATWRKRQLNIELRGLTPLERSVWRAKQGKPK